MSPMRQSLARDPRQKSEVAPRRILIVWVSVDSSRSRSPNFRLINRRGCLLGSLSGLLHLDDNGVSYRERDLT